MNLCKYLIFILFFYACATGLQVKRSKQYGPQPFRTDRVSTFFLSKIPQWINFSTTGQCFRNLNTHFLNYQQINAAYSLEYEKLVQLQLMVNRETYRTISSVNQKEEVVQRILSPQERSRIFYEALDKVQGNVKQFKIPKYPLISLIWVDSVKEADRLKPWLAKLQNSSYTNEAIPVLVSLCMSTKELEDKVKALGMAENYTYALGVDGFSIYDAEYEARPLQQINLEKILGENKKLRLITHKLTEPSIKLSELKGNFQIVKY